ncbi:hypothetical protein [Streptomyces sp. RKAG337]|uniref:hypothetical protein n=1 Tax=Streptomyces sp. RKAG337 TaxID=2893404 RepID=UPI002033BD38|nr:hypothetical protein [Streptomyces sp. RKAG337]MCM2427968.1 hypothetical protein [Streptomyces sp. RKAG337]
MQDDPPAWETIAVMLAWVGGVTAVLGSAVLLVVTVVALSTGWLRRKWRLRKS